jgi:hypothetical protein
MIGYKTLLDEMYPEITEEEKEMKLNDLGLESERQIQEKEIEKVAKLIENNDGGFDGYRGVSFYIKDFPERKNFSSYDSYAEQEKQAYKKFAENLLNDGNDVEDIDNMLDLLYMITEEGCCETYSEIDLRAALKNFKVIRKEN